MNWIVLIVAGVFEIVWAVGLKYTDGFSKLGPSIVTVVSLGISMALLGVAIRTIPLGTAYAVWTGIGVLGTSVAGILLFDEPKDAYRVAFMLLIVSGIVGLKFTTHVSQ